MRRMGGQDAAFLYGETESWHMHVSALMIVDPSSAPGGFDFERLKALTRRTVADGPAIPLEARRRALRSRPTGLGGGGRLRPRLPHPSHRGSRARRTTRAGRARRPPRPPTSSTGASRCGRCGSSRASSTARMAILTKMHHSIIDGVSGMGLAEAILDLEPDPPPRADEVRESLHDQRVPGPLELLARGAFNMWTRTPYRHACASGARACSRVSPRPASSAAPISPVRHSRRRAPR